MSSQVASSDQSSFERQLLSSHRNIPCPIQQSPSSPIQVEQSPSTTRDDRHREPPTGRLQPGRRFLSIIPTAPFEFSSILSSLSDYANARKPPLDDIVVQQLKDKFEDFTYEGHSSETALALSLCWLYTVDSWVYVHVNNLLRDDSSVMISVAPFMNGLMKSYKLLGNDSSYFFSGIVYRRTKLTPKGLEFYKTGMQFIWSAFTSTTVEFCESNNFGDILFVISIPDHMKCYALSLEGVSQFPTEREVLLLPNIGYFVKSISNGPNPKYPNTTTVIELEVAYVCVA